MEPLNDQLPDADLFEVDVIQTEYADILTFLQTNRMLEDYTPAQVKSFLQRNSPYTLIVGTLFKQGKNGILRRCIFTHEIPMVLEGCHLKPCGGHFAGDVTARIALLAGY